MAWIYATKGASRRRKPPMVRINHRGRLNFNRRAVRDLGLADVRQVALAYDPDQDIIGIHPKPDALPADAELYRCRKTNSGLAIPARKAFRVWKLAPPALQCQPIKAKDGWIVIPLRQGVGGV